jgi:hypothetical protein
MSTFQPKAEFASSLISAHGDHASNHRMVTRRNHPHILVSKSPDSRFLATVENVPVSTMSMDSTSNMFTLDLKEYNTVSEIGRASGPMVVAVGAQIYLQQQPQVLSRVLRGDLTTSQNGTMAKRERSVLKISRDAKHRVVHFEKVPVEKSGVASSLASLILQRVDDECLDAATYLQSMSSSSQTAHAKSAQVTSSPPTTTQTESKQRRRVPRKCNTEDCTNSVVQGGLCISHGAKRKQCHTKGCKKHVKKGGLCSRHGREVALFTRKMCTARDCKNISVQGGFCITHGAKKRLCCETGCNKKARATWEDMCKRHFDASRPCPVSNPFGVPSSPQCRIISS